MVRDRQTRLMDAYDSGFSTEHPAVAWNEQSKTLRQHRAAKEGGNVGETEPTGDDPPPTPGTPPLPERNGAALAAHDAAAECLEEFAIRQRAGADMEGELNLARARRIDPAKVRAMTESMPGYGRIR